MSSTRPGQSLPDIVCLSHLRWDFVFQRPQHLMSRFARERRVLYVEEPVHGPGAPRLKLVTSPERVVVVTPQLPNGTPAGEEAPLVGALLRSLFAGEERGRVLWYYTPMAVPVAAGLSARAVVYDCMDELSLFRGAPPELLRLEEHLMRRADLVFTGGVSLWEAKRHRHQSIHAFPSSVDVAHFARARQGLPSPPELASIPRPRIVFCGVVDERMDLPLVRAVAAARPDWQLVFIGPVVKIDPATLPRGPNLHWLGGRNYAQLPQYLGACDVAIMPFARNEATRFISPTKTPEYLAAGLPVVSTSIRDVVRPYGECGLVRIADEPDAFVEAIGAALGGGDGWMLEADALLAKTSWDATWGRMRDLVDRATAAPRSPVGVGVGAGALAEAS